MASSVLGHLYPVDTAGWVLLLRVPNNPYPGIFTLRGRLTKVCPKTTFRRLSRAATGISGWQRRKVSRALTVSDSLFSTRGIPPG